MVVAPEVHRVGSTTKVRQRIQQLRLPRGTRAKVLCKYLMLAPLCVMPGYISLISVQYADAEVLALSVNAEVI